MMHCETRAFTYVIPPHKFQRKLESSKGNQAVDVDLKDAPCINLP